MIIVALIKKLHQMEPFRISFQSQKIVHDIFRDFEPCLGMHSHVVRVDSWSALLCSPYEFSECTLIQSLSVFGVHSHSSLILIDLWSALSFGSNDPYECSLIQSSPIRAENLQIVEKRNRLIQKNSEASIQPNTAQKTFLLIYGYKKLFVEKIDFPTHISQHKYDNLKSTFSVFEIACL